MVAGILGVERALAIGQAADQRAGALLAEQIAIGQAIGGEDLLDDAWPDRRRSRRRTVTGIDDLLRGVFLGPRAPMVEKPRTPDERKRHCDDTERSPVVKSGKHASNLRPGALSPTPLHPCGSCAAASDRLSRANYAVILFQPLSSHMKMADRRLASAARRAVAPREHAICANDRFGFLAARYERCVIRMPSGRA